MARIYDNIETKFREGLHGMMSSHGVERTDFCVGYLNLRGWKMIIDDIDNLHGGYVEEEDGRKFRVCRLLVGMHRPPEDLVREMYSHTDTIADADIAQRNRRQIAEGFRKQLLLGLPTKEDEWTLRRLSAQLKEGKVCVKLFLREPLHAKLYLTYRPDDFSSKIVAIMGSSNLTYSGFKGQGELNADFTDSDHAEKLARWFDDRWNDRFCLDITDDLTSAIDNSWAGEKVIPPYYIYLKTAYHLSQEARAGINEYTLSPLFQRELFDFQQIAVKIATRHLLNEKRRGAMIGDVVGLGKTITACAISNIFERSSSGGATLIICPANLQIMWRKKVDKYNLKADIMSMSSTIDVEQSRYYRLIIIDESQNLRGGSGGKHYANIKQLISYQDCCVLLLSATPYNKDFSDLANQLKLFISEDQDLGIRPEMYIKSLGGERKFMEKHSDIPISSIKAFEKSESVEDWNELMKLFLVRRTRTFIRENYAKTDETDGRKYLLFNDGTRSYFPDRIPRAIKFQTEKGDQYSRLYSAEMIDMMDKLKLPRYGLNAYISDKKINEVSDSEQQIIDNLSRAGSRMMGFCKSTFFKRIDSSGYAFLLTLYRHILRNMIFVYAIDNKLPLPIGDEYALPDDFTEDQDVAESIFADETETQDNFIAFPTDLNEYGKMAEQHYNTISGKNRVKWLSSKYFKRTLKQHLIADCNKIIEMINLCGAWNPDTDAKLDCIQRLLEQDHKDDKVVVFTQFSDTACYVYRQLKKRGISHIECATGACKNPTELAERFSPESNDKRASVTAEQELRVLIATDVLSEGQNLQDAHVVVNYDLPWAIIRLIQRAGRVDRIGQKSEKIYCYSFFPADGVEEIIRLRSRLNERLNTNANLVGADEVFFEGNEQNLRNMFNEKSGVLDDDDDSDVDLASQAYQIWKNATDANPKLKKIIPSLSDMVYSTKSSADLLHQGVITYARNADDFDMLIWLDKDGETVSQSQKLILQTLSCSADTEAAQPLDNHHELVSEAAGIIKKQSTVSIGGILGSRFSTRYRIIKRLENIYNAWETDLFHTDEMKNELKLTIDDIYNHPLLDSAKALFGQLLRRANDDEIVEQALEMRRKGCLCPINEDENREPKVICSMGLRKEE